MDEVAFIVVCFVFLLIGLVLGIALDSKMREGPTAKILNSTDTFCNYWDNGSKTCTTRTLP